MQSFHITLIMKRIYIISITSIHTIVPSILSYLIYVQVMLLKFCSNPFHTNYSFGRQTIPGFQIMLLMKPVHSLFLCFLYPKTNSISSVSYRCGWYQLSLQVLEAYPESFHKLHDHQPNVYGINLWVCIVLQKESFSEE